MKAAVLISLLGLCAAFPMKEDTKKTALNTLQLRELASLIGKLFRSNTTALFSLTIHVISIDSMLVYVKNYYILFIITTIIFFLYLLLLLLLQLE